MKGVDVLNVRLAFRLSPTQLSDLLGTSPSTVYRWETVVGDVTIEPSQLRVLQLMQKATKQSAARQQKLVDEIHESLLIGNGLRALYCLLHAQFGKRKR